MIGAQFGLFDEAIRPGRLVPRPYQGETVSAIHAEWERVRSTLAVLPCGAGKTIIFSSVARKRGGALVLAHRDSLIRQAAAKLAIATGETIQIEKAERTAFAGNYICASVQTLKGKRLDRFALRFPEIHTIIVDEGHRGVAKSYRAIYAKWPNAKILLVTATADRSDKIGLKSVAESVAYRYELEDAIADGWLAPLKLVPVQSTINLDKIDSRAGDLDQDQLDDATNQQAGKIARAILEAGPAKRLIVFTAGVKTAHGIADALNELESNCARALDGTTEGEKRAKDEADHRAGLYRYMVSCALHLEGYDDPTLDGIFDAAPTKSRLRYAQKVGRGTRTGIDVDSHVEAAWRKAAIAAGPKPFAWVFDLVCSGSKHSLAGPVDLLAGKEPAEIKARAAKILREEGGTVPEAVDKAKREIDAAKAAKAAAAIARRTKVLVGEPRDIFKAAGLGWIEKHAHGITSRDPANQREIGLLRYRRIPVPPNCSRAQFRRLMKVDRDRDARGRVNLFGVKWLGDKGYDAWGWTKAQGERVRREILTNGAQKIPLERLANLLEREAGEDDE